MRRYERACMTPFDQSMSQLRSRLIEWLHAPVRARLHDAAFHDGKDESCQSVQIAMEWQAVADGFQTSANGGGPRGEIGGAAVVRREVFRLDLERQSPDGTAILASSGQQLLAIALQDGEDALDRIAVTGKRGPQDGWLQTAQVVLQHGQQERLFAGEDVVETAAVHVRALQQFGHAGGGVAFLPEQVAGGVEQ